MNNDHIIKLKYYLQKGGLNYWDWLFEELKEKIRIMKTELEMEEENKRYQKLISEVYFKTRNFQIINSPSLPKDISWNSAFLYIPDMISGGNSGKVIVNYYQEEGYTYLQTVEQLEKKEFEIIFGFNCGQFIKNKIISLNSTNIKIN